MRLNQELIGSILRKRIGACSKEELAAILEMFGFTVKEFHASGTEENPQVYFEVHYSIYYIIGISAEKLVWAVSYHNPYVQEMGVSMPTDNVADLISIMVDFWMPRYQWCNYEGPVYREDINEEYKSIEDMQSVLDLVQKELDVVIRENQKKEQERKKKPAVELGTGKVADLLAGLVGELDERKMGIFIEAINGAPDTKMKVSGVRSEDGQTLYGTEDAAVLTWDEFTSSIIKVGNISLT